MILQGLVIIVLRWDFYHVCSVLLPALVALVTLERGNINFGKDNRKKRKGLLQLHWNRHLKNSVNANIQKITANVDFAR